MKIKNKKIFIVFALLLMCLYFTLSTCYGEISYALIETDGITYTNVLEDLQKDNSFDCEKYVVDNNNYTLHVIQIAESNNDELFIYVYQPCSPNEDLTATSINISTGIDNNLSYQNYTLSFINNNGVFSKYKVRNFKILSENIRYYDISSIFRKWDINYDEGLPEINDNKITEVSFAVATRFSAKTMADNTIEYSNISTDVVYITDKWCGSCRYKGGYALLDFPDSCDSWFVAFNTDRDIERLMEADVYYVEQSWFHGTQFSPYTAYIDTLTPNEITDENINNYSKIAHLDYTQKGEFQGKGWWASKYEWKRISTVEDFIANENRENIYNIGNINVKKEEKMNDASFEKLRNNKWVLRFVETAYKEDVSTTASYVTQSIISSVSILRLKFETDGVVYNVGVIDNKQSPDLIPDNETIYSIEIADWFKMLFSLLMLILLVFILSPFLPIIFSLLGVIIKVILKVVLYVLKLPFKLLKAIFRRKER